MFLVILCCLFTTWLQNVGAECPTIIGRKEWDSDKPKYIKYLTTPVSLVVIQHTVTQTCSNDLACANVVREIQKIHMNEAFLWDIGPSFLIASTGKIYEGRGWHHVAVHTYGYNNQSFGFAFIGNFINQEPTQEALDAARSLIQCGVDEDLLTADHQVVLHNQLIDTESPGKKLANRIMSWPDWKQNVTEIKKRADSQDVKNYVDTQGTEAELVDFRSAEDFTPTVKSRPKREILTTTKEIDLLTNARDMVSELIDNIRKLAHQTMNTIVSLSRGLNRQTSLILEQLTSRLRRYRNQINSAVSSVSLLPGFKKCTKPVKERADIFYAETEGKVKDCTDQRVNEIDNLIKNLGTLSSNAINFSNTAVEETRNCTELNFGIELSTRACLNSVTSRTHSATRMYESQRTLVLSTIQSAMDSLPAALDLCAKKPLLDASAETQTIVSQVTNCGPSLLPGW